MLQKSKSKTVSKLKFLFILPLMLVMLTYVACSDDLLVPEHGETHSTEMGEQDREVDDAPFAIIENFPIYPGCEGLSSDEDRKRCMVEKIRENQSEKMRESVRKMFEHEETHSTETLGHQDQEIDDIPFAIIEEVPLFPGCEALGTNEDRKNCMTKKVTDIVHKNFDTSLGKQNGLEGVNRVYVKFKISKDGKVEVLDTRTPHPALQEEAERVVNLLPQMIPGKQNGEEVGVLYFLPIIFRSNNDQ